MNNNDISAYNGREWKKENTDKGRENSRRHNGKQTANPPILTETGNNQPTMSTSIVVATLLVVIHITHTTQGQRISCKNEIDCQGKAPTDKIAICVQEICSTSKAYGESCREDIECDATDSYMMCSREPLDDNDEIVYSGHSGLGVCTCDRGYSLVGNSCQPRGCVTSEECASGEKCVDGQCSTTSALFNLATFATVSSFILAFCLVLVVLVYTQRKIRKKKREWRESKRIHEEQSGTSSGQSGKKTTTYMGTYDPESIVSLNPVPEEEERDIDLAKPVDGR